MPGPAVRDAAGPGDLAGRTGPAAEVRDTRWGPRVHRVHLGPGTTRPDPHVVCVLGAEPGEVPAMTLVGLLHPEHGGRVVEAPEAERLGLRQEDAVARLRWYPGSGQVQGLSVAAEHRRRGIGVRMLLTAEAVQASHGWPALRTTGEVTPDGLALARWVPAAWRDRLPPSYEVLAPDGSRTGGARLPA